MLGLSVVYGVYVRSYLVIIIIIIMIIIGPIYKTRNLAPCARTI
jgi:hypothetical protein